MYRIQISMDIESWKVIPSIHTGRQPITSFVVDDLEEAEEIIAQLEVEVEDKLSSLRKDYE